MMYPNTPSLTREPVKRWWKQTTYRSASGTEIVSRSLQNAIIDIYGRVVMYSMLRKITSDLGTHTGWRVDVYDLRQFRKDGTQRAIGWIEFDVEY